MEWAIVAVVLLAVGGVAWYVLRSTPSPADIQGAQPGKDGAPPLAPGTITITATDGHSYVAVGGPRGGGRVMTEDEAKAYREAHPIDTRGTVSVHGL